MNNILGLGIFALGIVLLIVGFSESEAISSELSRVFSGDYSNRNLLMLVGGGTSVVLGLFVAIRSRKG